MAARDDRRSVLEGGTTLLGDGAEAGAASDDYGTQPAMQRLLGTGTTPKASKGRPSSEVGGWQLQTQSVAAVGVGLAGSPSVGPSAAALAAMGVAPGGEVGVAMIGAAAAVEALAGTSSSGGGNEAGIAAAAGRAEAVLVGKAAGHASAGGRSSKIKSWLSSNGRGPGAGAAAQLSRANSIKAPPAASRPLAAAAGQVPAGPPAALAAKAPPGQPSTDQAQTFGAFLAATGPGRPASAARQRHAERADGASSSTHQRARPASAAGGSAAFRATSRQQATAVGRARAPSPEESPGGPGCYKGISYSQLDRALHCGVSMRPRSPPDARRARRQHPEGADVAAGQAAGAAAMAGSASATAAAAATATAARTNASRVSHLPVGERRGSASGGVGPGSVAGAASSLRETYDSPRQPAQALAAAAARLGVPAAQRVHTAGAGVKAWATGRDQQRQERNGAGGGRGHALGAAAGAGVACVAGASGGRAASAGRARGQQEPGAEGQHGSDVRRPSACGIIRCVGVVANVPLVWQLVAAVVCRN